MSYITLTWTLRAQGWTMHCADKSSVCFLVAMHDLFFSSRMLPLVLLVNKPCFAHGKPGSTSTSIGNFFELLQDSHNSQQASAFCHRKYLHQCTSHIYTPFSSATHILNYRVIVAEVAEMFEAQKDIGCALMGQGSGTRVGQRCLPRWVFSERCFTAEFLC